MKKLLKKRVLIPLIVVVAVAIGGAIAYAAFTPPNAVSTANVSAGTTAITFTSTNTGDGILERAGPRPDG